MKFCCNSAVVLLDHLNEAPTVVVQRLVFLTVSFPPAAFFQFSEQRSQYLPTLDTNAARSWLEVESHHICGGRFVIPPKHELLFPDRCPRPIEKNNVIRQTGRRRQLA